MLFFSELLSNLNRQYSTLLGIKDEKDDKEGKESGNETKDAGDNKPNSFNEKWSWIISVKNVADMVHIDWSTVFKMEIMEFLNIMSFCKDYYQEEKRMYEELKLKYKK